MKPILRFGRFWYDFVIGDDWRVAVVVIVSIAIVTVTAHHGLNWWWFLPLAVAGVLTASVVEVARRR